MRVVPVFVFLLFTTVQANAQVQLSVGGGLTDSTNLGEIGPAPILKSNLTIGDRFRFENDFKFSSMDKYTGAGWFISNGVNFLVSPSGPGLFVVGGMDYTHRNGGQWAKDGIKIGGGIGYQKDNSQIRFSVKDKVVSLNDDVKYYPVFEFLARGETPINDSWSLRFETGLGFFQYIQNNFKSTAFYLDTTLGLAYKWP